MFRGLPPNGPHYAFKGEEMIVKPGAFNDRSQKPSVDVVRLCPERQPQPHLRPEDGVLELSVGTVRACGRIEIRGKRGEVTKSYTADVWLRPEESNLAHAQIEAAPDFNSKKHFRKLKIALAREAKWYRLPPPNHPPG